MKEWYVLATPDESQPYGYRVNRTNHDPILTIEMARHLQEEHNHKYKSSTVVLYKTCTVLED